MLTYNFSWCIFKVVEDMQISTTMKGGINLQLKLRAKRVEHGMNQKDMAEKLNITANSYSRKERGVCEFTYTEIITILKLFNCKFEDVFFTE